MENNKNIINPEINEIDENATEPTYKHCKNCDISKDINDFYKRGKYIATNCRKCDNKKRSESNQKNGTFKKWYEQNKKICSEKQKLRYALTKEKNKILKEDELFYILLEKRNKRNENIINV